MKKSGKRGLFICLCVAPASILFAIFMIVPTINVFRISLFERGAYSSTETYVGLKNFETLLGDTRFIASLQNTLLLIVFVTVITFFFAILFAGILTGLKLKGSNFFRVIFYIPNILSVVVIAGIFSAIYRPENGLLNSVLSMFSKEQVMILWKDQPMVILSIIIAMVWQGVSYYMVMYMAAMAAVPVSLYESAGLDGAKGLRRFISITLPLIWTSIRTTLTFFIISSINMAFLFVRAMVARGMSDVGLSFMYNQKDAGLFGYSMSAGVIIFLLSFILSAVVNRATKRDVVEL